MRDYILTFLLITFCPLIAVLAKRIIENHIVAKVVNYTLFVIMFICLIWIQATSDNH